MAVAETDGTAPFYVTGFEEASSLLPFASDGLKQWRGNEDLRVTSTLTAPTIRLDTFLEQRGIAEVDYLKIDAQGGDLAVIRSLGGRLRDVKRISLEVQVTAQPLYQGAPHKDEVVAFLAGVGFRLISCERQSQGQEENLTFSRHLDLASGAQR